MSTIQMILSILNGAWTLLSNLFGFGKKSQPDENTQAVEVANKSGELAADQARATRRETDKEISANDAQTDADVAAVRDAGSLRDGAAIVNQAISRASAHTGANR